MGYGRRSYEELGFLLAASEVGRAEMRGEEGRNTQSKGFLSRSRFVRTSEYLIATV